MYKLPVARVVTMLFDTYCIISQRRVFTGHRLYRQDGWRNSNVPFPVQSPPSRSRSLGLAKAPIQNASRLCLSSRMDCCSTQVRLHAFGGIGAAWRLRDRDSRAVCCWSHHFNVDVATVASRGGCCCCCCRQRLSYKHVGAPQCRLSATNFQARVCIVCAFKCEKMY